MRLERRHEEAKRDRAHGGGGGEVKMRARLGGRKRNRAEGVKRGLI